MIHLFNRYGSGTTTNGRQPASSSGFGQLVEDVASLAELQLELLRAELRESVRSTILSLCALVAGAALVFSAFPVLLLSFAYLLVEQAGLSTAAALVIAAAVGLAAAAAIIVWAVIKLRSAPEFLRRSQEEFLKNIRWIERAAAKPARAASADRNGASTSL